MALQVSCPLSKNDTPDCLVLTAEELARLVERLHRIDSHAGYLHDWAQRDGAETSALATIRQSTAELLTALNA
jgi:hypothetical protein